MIRSILSFLPLYLVLILASCAPMTMNQFIKEGKTVIPPEKLHSAVSGKTLHLEAIDFDAKVSFTPDGRLRAENNEGDTDQGHWKISKNKQLCLKFKSWYFNDIRCYSIIEVTKDNYVFFTANGARYYTGTVLQNSLVGNNLTENQTKENTLPASTSTHRRAKRANIDKKHTLLQLARNCPDCNLSGVNLQDAELVTANLSGANLSESNLSDANLRRANLSGANLSGAKLLRTNLSGANLSNCNLSEADLTGSNLIYADLTGANLSGAIFTRAHLEHIKGMTK